LAAEYTRRDAAEGRRIEGRGVVDQHVEAAEARDGRLHEAGQRRGVEQVAGRDQGRVRALALEAGGERIGLRARAVAMDDDVGAGRVQVAHDLGADAPRRAGDQRGASL
jgi:hypothetical protein